jgi:hypothetical protein
VLSAKVPSPDSPGDESPECRGDVTRCGSDVIELDGRIGEGGGVLSSRTESRLPEPPKNDHFLRSRLEEDPPGVAASGVAASSAARASITLSPSAEGVRVLIPAQQPVSPAQRA